VDRKKEEEVESPRGKEMIQSVGTENNFKCYTDVINKTQSYSLHTKKKKKSGFFYLI